LRSRRPSGLCSDAGSDSPPAGSAPGAHPNSAGRIWIRRSHYQESHGRSRWPHRRRNPGVIDRPRCASARPAGRHRGRAASGPKLASEQLQGPTFSYTFSTRRPAATLCIAGAWWDGRLSRRRRFRSRRRRCSPAWDSGRSWPAGRCGAADTAASAFRSAFTNRWPFACARRASAGQDFVANSLSQAPVYRLTTPMRVREVTREIFGSRCCQDVPIETGRRNRQGGP
jgi:hypothetical protein